MKQLITALFVLLAMPFYAQNSIQKISLSFNDISLSNALSQIKNECKCKIAYDENHKQMTQKINANIKNLSIEEAIKKALTETELDVKTVGTTFVIFEQKDKNSSFQNNEQSNDSEKPIEFFHISGYVHDKSNGESLIGVVVQEESFGLGEITNAYGYFSIALPKGKVKLNASYLGYASTILDLIVDKNMTINLKLDPESTVIKEVVVTASSTKAKEMVRSTDMSKITVPIEVLKKVPVLFGESDIIKAIQLLPGIKRGREGGLGMYIRGGGNDENLILLDEATVYNPGHLLGFLSIFNSNSLKSTDIYKGAFPSVYGGRLSGVLDVRMKEGNDQKFGAEGSIGNIASSLTFEAPIIKDKCSFVISGRRSYLDRIVNIAAKGLFPYYFYDLNAKVNYKLNQNDRLFLSSYIGRDILNIKGADDSLGIDLGFGYSQGNTTSTARWNHIYKGNKLFHNLTLISSNFKYSVNGSSFGSSIGVKSAINDLGLKLDYDYAWNESSQLKFGAQVINHIFKPNLYVTQGDSLGEIDEPKIVISNYETGLYGNLDKDFAKRLKFNFGLRLTGSYSGTTNYLKLEPRTSLRFSLHERHSLKVGFARMNQYMHLVAGSTIALPTDLWYPATKLVKPGQSDQVNFGYYTYVGKNDDIQISLETYYKWMRNLVEYKEGARIILNNDYEKELVFGKGHAYGTEFMIQKNKGIVTGWVGYTLSWTKRQSDDINNGKEYYSRFDRRHDVSAVVNLHDVKHPRVGLSFAWVYSSGSPFTPIISKYIQPTTNFNGVDILPIYSERNAHRLNGASRLDIDFVFYGKKRKHFQGEWHMGAYNALNQVQPSRVVITFDEKTKKEKYQEKGLFGFIFSIAYKFKF